MAAPNSTMQQKGGISKFMREVKAEMRKVIWPTKQELINYTIVVFATVIFIAVLIGIVDGIFTELFKMFTRIG